MKKPLRYVLLVFFLIVALSAGALLYVKLAMPNVGAAQNIKSNIHENGSPAANTWPIA